MLPHLSPVAQTSLTSALTASKISIMSPRIGILPKIVPREPIAPLGLSSLRMF